MAERILYCKDCPDKKCHAVTPTGKLVVVGKPDRGYYYWSNKDINDCKLKKEKGATDNRATRPNEL
jgi:hypothetical protein